jgi:hypothetical protein
VVAAETTHRTFAKIAVIAGAGAQEGSWEPVIRALQSVGCDGVACSDTANTALAQLVIQRRFAHESQSPAIDKIDENYGRAIAAIRDQVKAAQDGGNISLRGDFVQTWNTVIADSAKKTSTIAFITTNWDEVWVNKVRSLYPGAPADPGRYHLHGGLTDDDPILLPSEKAIEPYRQLGSTAATRLLERRQALVTGINEAQMVVLWGLGLSPLDAELMLAIWIGLWGEASSRVERIVIINPDHQCVAKRLIALFPRDRRNARLPQLRGWFEASCDYAWPQSPHGR